jgi:hypothetical protein
MTRIAVTWAMVIAPRVRSWCSAHASALTRLLAVLLAVVVAWRAAYALPITVAKLWSSGGIDVFLRHQDVRAWFGGYPVYSILPMAVYPPASYVMLWPALGWMSFSAAHKVWAVTSVLALGWLSYLLVRVSGAERRLSTAFVALTPLCVYATEETIRVGQLGIHLLAVLTAGFIVLGRGRGGWQNDMLASALILLSLVKPQFSAPFFWIVMFVVGRARPALIVLLAYVALTAVGASFQQGSLASIIRKWTTQRPQAGLEEGYGSIHAWLVDLHLRDWILWSSLIVVVVFGIWVFRNRRAELWLLVGVAALVARFWAYHRSYDNLLLLLPMISLYRLARSAPHGTGSDVTAAVLLVLLWTLSVAGAQSMIFSARIIAFQWAETAVWLAVLVFLLRQVSEARNSPERRRRRGS